MNAATASDTNRRQPNSGRPGNLSLQIWGVTAIALLSIGSYLAWLSYDEYENTLDQEYRILETLARFGESQMAGSLRSIDLLLQDVIDDKLSANPPPAEFVQHQQRNRLRQFPEIHFLITTDSRGQVTTAESLDDPNVVGDVRKFNASERDYFKVHRDAGPEDHYRYQISRPFKTITNRNTITISRAIRGEAGQFQGVALVSLSPAYFDSVSKQMLAAGPADAAAVHNRFGDIIYRLPDPEKYIGKNIADGPAFKSYLSSNSHLTRYLGVTATDGVKRILVFGKVGNTNLDVAVSAQFDIVMARWRSNLLIKGLIFLIVSGMAIALATGRQRRLLERRQNEEALRESDEFHRAILETTLDGFWRVDTQGSLLDVNPAYCRNSGYTREELIGMRISDLEVGETSTETAEHIQRIAKNGGDRFESRHRRKDGSIWNVEVSVTYRDIGQGEFFVFLRDITKRKKGEEELNEQAQRLRLASDSAALGIWDWNVRDNTLMWDDRMFELYGVRKEATPNNIEAWTNGLHPDDKDRAIAECQAALRGEKPFDTVFRVRHPDGTVKHLKGNAIVMRDADGNANRMLGINADITEQIRLAQQEAEHYAAVAQSEAKYRALFDNANDGIFIMDARGFIDCNDKGAQMYGLRREQLLGRSPVDLSPERQPDGRLSSEVAAERIGATVNGHGQSFEWQTLRADQVLIDVEITLSRIFVSGSPCILAIVRDITARKRLQSALETRQAELEDLYRKLQTLREDERTRIARELHDGTGHLLTALLMDLGWLDAKVVKDGSPISAKVSSAVELGEQVVDTLRGLMEDLRPPILDELGLVSALESYIDSYVKRTGLRCQLELAGDPTPIRGAIATDIYRMVQEALNNVSKHADAAKVVIHLTRTADCITLVIEDDGKGMLQESQSGRARFGLRGMRERVALLGGTFSVTSEPGQGVRIEAAIPIGSVT